MDEDNPGYNGKERSGKGTADGQRIMAIGNRRKSVTI
jgi:hypothetical protein